MQCIKIDPNRVSELASKMKTIEADIETTKSMINSAKNGLDWKVASKAHIEERLKKIQNRIQIQSETMGQYANALAMVLTGFAENDKKVQMKAKGIVYSMGMLSFASGATKLSVDGDFGGMKNSLKDRRMLDLLEPRMHERLAEDKGELFELLRAFAPVGSVVGVAGVAFQTAGGTHGTRYHVPDSNNDKLLDSMMPTDRIKLDDAIEDTKELKQFKKVLGGADSFVENLKDIKETADSVDIYSNEGGEELASSFRKNTLDFIYDITLLRKPVDIIDNVSEELWGIRASDAFADWLPNASSAIEEFGIDLVKGAGKGIVSAGESFGKWVGSIFS